MNRSEIELWEKIFYGESDPDAVVHIYDPQPLSVRTGGRRKRFSWWVKGQREELAYRLAPWLRAGR